jgi:hypothetical protein
MACAAHGLNIISCYADAAKSEPLSLLISPQELMKEITTAELHSRAARLREWQNDLSLAADRERDCARVGNKKSSIVKPIKLLLVSPCLGAYGGIEAFVMAVATAVRREPDFEVRVVFKKTKYFAKQPSLKQMLHGKSVDFCERADKDLAAEIRWADVVNLQNASPDVVLLAKLFRKRLVLTFTTTCRANGTRIDYSGA